MFMEYRRLLIIYRMFIGEYMGLLINGDLFDPLSIECPGYLLIYII